MIISWFTNQLGFCMKYSNTWTGWTYAAWLRHVQNLEISSPGPQYGCYRYCHGLSAL